MAAQDGVIKDIFGDADKVEILGKLPSILWAYLETARSLVRNIDTTPGSSARSAKDTEKILGILESAAEYLGNESLKSTLGGHSKMLSALGKGELSEQEFAKSFVADLPRLEGMAGPRPESLPDPLISSWLADQAPGVEERIRKGRAGDLIVSVELLDEIRDYLAAEAISEGIRSILIVDNAGTLVINIGDKADLDAVSLAAVAAANFAATEKIAHLIGERDFVLLFYKGHTESFHFTRAGKDYIVVTIFDNSLSLGLLRLKITEVAQFLTGKLPKREV